MALPLVTKMWKNVSCLYQSKSLNCIGTSKYNKYYFITSQLLRRNFHLNTVKIKCLRPNNRCSYTMHGAAKQNSHIFPCISVRQNILNHMWTAINSKYFHTSARQSIHPLFWLAVRPLAKVGTILTGRVMRKWWKRLPENEKIFYRKKMYISRGRIMVACGVLTTAGVVNYITHLQETPITKRKRYIALTSSQFQTISQLEFDMQWEKAKDGVLPPSSPYYQRVVQIVQRIVNSNQDLQFMTKQKWTVIVINSTQLNAFVLPTGHIFVFTGIMDFAENDHQLATVLGHEMAHALLNHGAEQMSVAQLVDYMIIIFLGVIWFFMPTDGAALFAQWIYTKVVRVLLELPYSRKLENEADVVGLELIAKACYDVRESSNFWNIMALLADTTDEEEPPEWLSTHPSNETRVDALNKLIPKALEIRDVCKCPKLLSKDPRKDTASLKEFVSERKKEGKKVEIVLVPAPAK